MAGVGIPAVEGQDIVDHQDIAVLPGYGDRFGIEQRHHRVDVLDRNRATIAEANPVRLWPAIRIIFRVARPAIPERIWREGLAEQLVEPVPLTGDMMIHEAGM